MTNGPGGAIDVRFTAGGLRELAWDLVTWGDTVRVVAPEALRTELAEVLRRAAAALTDVAETAEAGTGP